MKKVLLFVLAAMMVFAMAACGAPAEESGQPSDSASASASGDTSATSDTGGADDSLVKIKEKGELILGLDDAFPPFGYRDEENNIVGFDIDLATEVCERMGVELKLQPIVWDSNIAELESGNVDCLWNGLTITEKRAEKITFTEPYIENHQMIVVPADSDINSKADLAGKVVGVQAGSSAIDAIEADPETMDSFQELVQMKDNVLLLTEIKAGTVDAGVIDELVAKNYCSSQPDVYRMLEEPMGDEQYAVGFRKEDVALANEVSKILDEMREDGTYDEIYAKWQSQIEGEEAE